MKGGAANQAARGGLWEGGKGYSGKGGAYLFGGVSGQGGAQDGGRSVAGCVFDSMDARNSS